MALHPPLLVTLVFIFYARGDFVCENSGRYENPEDESCRSYYLCSKLKNGSFIATPYNCPKSAVFNPKTQVCSSQYTCVEADATTANVVDPGFVCTKKGRFVDETDPECQRYYLCSSLKNGTFIETLYTCPGSARFDPKVGRCRSNYSCTKQTTPSYTVKPDVFICSEEGRFKDVTDETCCSYYLCSRLKNGSFISTKYRCPKGSYFDQSIRKCSTSYLCPGVMSTTDSITAQETVTQGTEEFTCEKKGRFRDPIDNNCAHYFLCAQLRNGSFIKQRYSCPPNTSFDPSLQMCSALYTCPTFSDKTTLPTGETGFDNPQVSSSTKPPDDFVCHRKGRFRDPGDHTCQLYYLCSQLRNGTFIQTKYRCPEGSRFDPELGKCSTTFVCPGGAAATTESWFSEDAGDDDYSEDTSWTQSSFETSVYTDSDEEDATGRSKRTTEFSATGGTGNDFVCEKKGRFQDVTDPNGKRYFLCSKFRNGTYIKTMYTCPKEAVFDVGKGICSQLTSTLTTTQSMDNHNHDETCETDEVITYDTSDVDDSKTTQPHEDGGEEQDDDGCSTAEVMYPEDYDTKSSEEQLFVCTKNGRFKDPSCRMSKLYYLCSQCLNGTFVAKKFRCPKDHVFCAELQKCISIVDAESSKTTKTKRSTETTESIQGIEETGTEEFTCTEKGRFLNVSDPTQRKYILCTQLSNSTFLKSSYECPNGTKFYNEINSCITDEAALNALENSNTSTTTNYDNTECTQKDRIPDESDPTRTKYILCSQLSNGTYLQTTYTCPNGTNFSAEIKTCITEEAALKQRETSTTPKSTIPSNGSTSPAVSPFKCRKKGRFLDVNDPTQTKYFLCSQLRNGSFVKSDYRCPHGSTFSTDMKICVKTTTTENPPTTQKSGVSFRIDEDSSSGEVFSTEADDDSFVCTSKGRFEDVDDVTKSRYFLCTQLSNGTLLKSTYECPENTFFYSKLEMCSTKSPNPEYVLGSGDPGTCGCTDSECTVEQMYDDDDGSFQMPDQNVFECTREGRFADETDTLKIRYFLCSKTGDGSFKKTMYRCKVNTKFDSTTGTCVQEISSTTTKTTTNFECQEEGNFPDTNDESSQQYITCIKSEDSGFTQMLHRCPTEAVFDEDTGSCCAAKNNRRKRSNTAEKENGVSGILIPTENTDDDSFACTHEGSFAANVENTKYYECKQFSNGSFVKTKYGCVSGSKFSPELGYCVTTNDCANNKVSGKFICTIEGTFPDLSDLTSTRYFVCSQLHNGSLFSDEFKCPNGTKFDKTTLKCVVFPITTSPIFCCKKRGYFPNQDNNSKYYICDITSDGSLYEMRMSCPKSYYFDASTNLCTPKDKEKTPIPCNGTKTFT